MKIVAFEVWEYEHKYFEQMTKEIEGNTSINFLQNLPLAGVSLDYYMESLSMKNIELAKGADGISINVYCKIDKPVLDILKSYGVKHISCRSIGTDNVDKAYAKSIGIKVTNINYGPESVADFAILLILEGLRKVKLSWQNSSKGDFILTNLIGKNLADMTVGIVGTGSIGTSVIKKLSGFGCKVLAYSRNVNPQVEELNQKLGSINDFHVQYVPFDTLLNQCDVISVHTALTKDTENLLDEGAFSKMKDGVVIVNTARGEIIDQTALIKNIKNGKVSAAALDVFCREDGIVHHDLRKAPPNLEESDCYDEELKFFLESDQVLIYPHIGFLSEETLYTMGVGSISNLIKDLV